MALSDKEIIELVNADKPLITPFDQARLRAASYDVALSDSVQEVSALPGVVDLSDDRVMKSVYKAIDISAGYILKPGQFALCKLEERLELADNLVAHVMPRTRFTRLGLLVSAQHCNPGYTGTLSLGLYNASPNNVSLVPGMSIAQLVFERLLRAPSPERLYCNQAGARFHGEDDFVGSRFGDELSPEAKRIFDEMTGRLSGGEG